MSYIAAVWKDEHRLETVEIKVGDVVTVFGQNVSMTVEGFEYGKVHCVWFNDADQLQRYWFEPGILRKEQS